MLGALAMAVVMLWLLRQWAATRDWSDRHRLALVSGALIFHNLIGGVILTKTTVDRVGVALLGLGMVVLSVIIPTRHKG
jgi:hypothetical protein